MSDDESTQDDELPNHLADSIRALKAKKISVVHPGITIDQFVEHMKLINFPATIRTIIDEIHGNDEDTEVIIRLWNEVENVVPAKLADLVGLYKVCCGLMLLPYSVDMTHLKMRVIHKVFLQTSRRWDVCPATVHVVCKELYPLLMDNRNLMYFIRIIALASQMAFYISCGLAFSLFFSLLGQESRMYQLYNFQAIIEEVKKINLQEIKEQYNVLYSILDTIGFLTNVIIFGKSGKMMNTSYKDFFDSTPEQIQYLLKWSQSVEKLYQSRSNNENDNVIMINELVVYDIIERLKEVLGDD